MNPSKNQFDSFLNKKATDYAVKKMAFGATPSSTIPITTDCQNCDATVSVKASYDPNWNSVTYSCPSCKSESTEHNWVDTAHRVGD